MSDRNGNGILWFLTGVGIGAVVGILYAPQSGAETRDIIMAKAEEGREFVRDRATKERFPDSVAFGVQVGRRALAHGLLCRFDPHWIAFGPPLIVTAEQIDEMVAVLDKSTGEALA